MVDNFDQFVEYYESQFEYYDSKATTNKWGDRITRVLQIVLTAVLPVTAALFAGTDEAIWRWIIVIIALLILIDQGLRSYLNYQKKWLSYRTTAESLRREKQLFDTKTQQYEADGDPQRLFVNRVMEIVEQENSEWETATRKAQEN